jgi:hypothetical protein
LFELTTQTASAYLESNSSSKAAKQVEREAADLNNSFKDLSSFDSTLRSRCASAMLDFLLYRIRLSMSSGADSVANWVKMKAEGLIKQEEIPPRKVTFPTLLRFDRLGSRSRSQLQHIIETVYQCGRSLALQAKDSDKLDLERSIEWLEWARDLVQLQLTDTSRPLKAGFFSLLGYASCSETDSLLAPHYRSRSSNASLSHNCKSTRRSRRERRLSNSSS